MAFLRKLLTWALILVMGYYTLEYLRTHTSSEVLAYKRFAKALMQDDLYSLRQVSSPEVAAKVYSQQSERIKLYQGSRILFSYYKVINRVRASDGKSATLIVEQVSRLSPEGHTGVWGDREVRVRHRVKLEQTGLSWRVTDFIDPVMH
ncbi:MAG: hypothetical protein ACNA77_04620 [Opitutales bacterium]